MPAGPLRFMVPMHGKQRLGLSMNRDPQTRMTNDDIRRNTETRRTKRAMAHQSALRHSCLGFHSSLVIRHSTTSSCWLGYLPTGAPSLHTSNLGLWSDYASERADNSN